MSDMTSSSRSGKPSSDSADQAAQPSSSVGSGSSPPDDQRTIISSQLPIAGLNESTERLESGRFAPGDMLGPYELLEYIGGGGMGRVFRAMDTQLSRVVALKVLPRDRAADMETLLRFRNEARSTARLDHESVVRVHQIGEERSFPYVVFEYVTGETIRSLVDHHGPLPLVDALSYTLQVADALTHAAERGVVHRDIKPSNVMITPDGRAKVIDFGLARLREVGDADSDLTASGVTLGTFDYISPEQARDPRAVDIRSDIYSLGCAFFFMLTGRPPFPEGTVLQKLLQHQGDKPPDLDQFRPELPNEVSLVLQKMLAKDPNHRYQTPLELVEHLQLLAEFVGLEPAGPGHRVWLAPRGRPVSLLREHLPWLLPVAALLCIVAALHFLGSSPPGAPSDPKPPSMASGPKAPADKVIELLPKIDATPPTDMVSADNAPASSESSAVSSSAAPTGAGEPPDPLANLTSDSTTPAALPQEPGGDRDLFDPNPQSELPATSLLAPRETIANLHDGLGWDDDFFGRLSAERILGNDNAESAGAGFDVGPSKSAGILTVGDPGGGSRNFNTLAAACSASESGDIIELRYNGRREEKPIPLPNAKLVIRAGAGFKPVVVFRPNESDPVKYPRSMFSLTGSELALLNLAIELDIPRDVPADRWTLLELTQAETLRLERCSLTIRNAQHREVAFFRVKASPAATVLTDQSPASDQAARITMTDCIVRGRAVVVRAESLQPVHLSWTNGLLLTSEQLLWAVGGDTMPPSGENIQVQLKHLTAMVGAGLCRLDNRKSGPYQLPTQINCSDSILMAASDSSLIEQLGQLSPEQSRSGITWTGDRNFYYGFVVFWNIDDLRPDTPPETLEFDAWRSRWAPDHEVHSRWGRIDFRQLPEVSRALETRGPEDYLLSDSVENWAHAAASDGSDVGFLSEQLPPLPPSP